MHWGACGCCRAYVGAQRARRPHTDDTGPPPSVVAGHPHKMRCLDCDFDNVATLARCDLCDALLPRAAGGGAAPAPAAPRLAAAASKSPPPRREPLQARSVAKLNCGVIPAPQQHEGHAATEGAGWSRTVHDVVDVVKRRGPPAPSPSVDAPAPPPAAGAPATAAGLQRGASGQLEEEEETKHGADAQPPSPPPPLSPPPRPPAPPPPSSRYAAAEGFPWSAAADEANRTVWGVGGPLRPLQLRAINAAMDGRDVLVVMPTGGGKSRCYQLPALLARDALTVVVAPLLSLILDQVAALARRSVRALYLASSQTREEAAEVHADLCRAIPTCRLLYVTPERLQQSVHLRSSLARLHAAGRIARLVVDEAHCVVSWGRDFRPDYLALAEVRSELLRGVPLMLLSATLPSPMRADLLGALGLDASRVAVVEGRVDRPNLFYEVWPKAGPKASADLIVAALRRGGGDGGAGRAEDGGEEEAEAEEAEARRRRRRRPWRRRVAWAAAAEWAAATRRRAKPDRRGGAAAGRARSSTATRKPSASACAICSWSAASRRPFTTRWWRRPPSRRTTRGGYGGRTRSWWRRRASGWASTRTTCGSSSIGPSPTRSSPSTRSGGAPAATAAPRAACCSTRTATRAASRRCCAAAATPRTSAGGSRGCSSWWRCARTTRAAAARTHARRAARR